MTLTSRRKGEKGEGKRGKESSNHLEAQTAWKERGKEKGGEGHGAPPPNIHSLQKREKKKKGKKKKEGPKKTVG